MREHIVCIYNLLLFGITLLASDASAQNTWQPPTNKIVILAVNSHPDDEGIFFGGALAYYGAGLKLPTLLISMTSGDWQPSNLSIREDELRCAAANYGLPYEPLFPRFKDVPSHSMANNPYPNKIDATWDYWADGVLQGDGLDVEAGKSKAINYLAEQIRRYRPEIVITHDEKGEYGHHNHIATSYAVTNAFYLAADPNATAPNLIGLPPWQVKKLYLHLYPQNKLFHAYTEIPLPSHGYSTLRGLADEGLNCQASQNRPDVSTVYRTGENFDPYPSEWWGLYATTVGPDTVVTTNTVLGGYIVPAGVAIGNFLENLGFTNTPSAPFFTADSLLLAEAMVNSPYQGPAPSRLAWDPDLLWGDSLSFEKLSGPAWLQISPEGVISGTPHENDAGTNVMAVRVQDSSGKSAEASLRIRVREFLPIISGLSGWWKLDEASGPLCYNSAQSSLHGTYTAAEFRKAGASPVTGTSVQFNGTSSKVDVPFAAELNPAQFTAVVWVNVQSGAGTYRSPLCSRESTPQSGYVFYAGQDDKWQFWLGATNAWRTLVGGAVRTNEWVHLAGTYDGSTARFYTNGTLAASATVTLRPNTKFPLRIGSGGSESSGQYWFPGMIDDVRIYNTALTGEQIAALRLNTAPKFKIGPPSMSVLAGTHLNGTLAGLAEDPGDALAYGKLEGPGWLRVAADGSLSGMPASKDIGPNQFKVLVADSFGAQASTGLDVYVLPGIMPALTIVPIGIDGGVKLTASAPTGQMYLIEACDDLAGGNWHPVITNTAGISLLELSETNSVQRNGRFFRAVIP